MKIIDSHLHLFGSDGHSDALAKRAGHINSVSHLRQVYSELGIVHGVVMGNGDPDPKAFPKDLFHYCIGLDRGVIRDGKSNMPDFTDRLETALSGESCCGIKIYAGYNRVWLSDKGFEPVYELAERYDKPVAVHMGATASSGASLKYAHPLTLDEVAADHPKTRFVMCHFGNPFLESAAAVLEKNSNVAADLSGLLEGRCDPDSYFEYMKGYTGLLKSWLIYMERWDGVMFGTDWPLVNYSEYIEFVKRLTPEKHWDKVFFENANRIYGLGL